jgi:uncharacterized membrane protein YdjX (TVP38/TMEM64 family)
LVEALRVLAAVPVAFLVAAFFGAFFLPVAIFSNSLSMVFNSLSCARTSLMGIM